MTEYYSFVIPLLVLIVTQVLKLSIDKIRGNLNFKNIFFSYGGMPSAHTALAVSVTTMMALIQGLASPIFGLALILTLIIMRDAATFRNILGQQGKLLNLLGKKIDPINFDTPKFNERIGHSLTEVAVGAIWGISCTLVLYWWLFY